MEKIYNQGIKALRYWCLLLLWMGAISLLAQSRTTESLHYTPIRLNERIAGACVYPLQLISAEGDTCMVKLRYLELKNSETLSITFYKDTCAMYASIEKTAQDAKQLAGTASFDFQLNINYTTYKSGLIANSTTAADWCVWGWDDFDECELPSFVFIIPLMKMSYAKKTLTTKVLASHSIYDLDITVHQFHQRFRFANDTQTSEIIRHIQQLISTKL
jgi:hypothetical protein